MHLIQIALLTLILSWGISELAKIPREVLRMLDIDLSQKRKNLTPSPNYVRFKLPNFKMHKKAYKLS